MTATHTPGPWKVIPGWQIVTAYDDGRSIAFLDWKSSSPKWTVSELSQQHDPNALLIAAAPQLAEALREIVRLIERGFLRNADMPGYKRDTNQGVAAARAALVTAGVKP